MYVLSEFITELNGRVPPRPWPGTGLRRVLGVTTRFSDPRLIKWDSSVSDPFEWFCRLPSRCWLNEDPCRAAGR